MHSQTPEHTLLHILTYQVAQMETKMWPRLSSTSQSMKVDMDNEHKPSAGEIMRFHEDRTIVAGL